MCLNWMSEPSKAVWLFSFDIWRLQVSEIELRLGHAAYLFSIKTKTNTQLMRWLEKMRISQIFRPVTTVRTCWSCQSNSNRSDWINFPFHISFNRFVYPTDLVQRSIYTDKQLSVQKYVAERDKLKMVMQSTFVDDKKKRLQKYFVPSAGQLAPQPWLLANDFVQFLHVIDDTEADFQLLEQLMDVFKRIDMTNLRNVNVGLILMKMLHHFKRDKSAMKVWAIIRWILDREDNKKRCLSKILSVPVLQRSRGAPKVPTWQTNEFGLLRFIVQAEKV